MYSFKCSRSPFIESHNCFKVVLHIHISPIVPTFDAGILLPPAVISEFYELWRNDVLFATQYYQYITVLTSS